MGCFFIAIKKRNIKRCTPSTNSFSLAYYRLPLTAYRLPLTAYRLALGLWLAINLFRAVE
ncbi:hypothetical protein GCM10008027_38040 [Pseudoalteromonas gelatinilytica]|uniref:Uncharacterized protein n=1 Tax=Pseudoalteromonas gelatinilytica TaxID=1703256 RepID=A0ABQ1U5B5_9GAMM|nr:hypothetical protein GCM10008027_38040 [Pseudoalteromonas profundi]